MSDTVASIEAAVQEQLDTSNTTATSVMGSINDLITSLSSLSRTMLIPAAPDPSAISYLGTTKSKIETTPPELPALDAPIADTSITYIDSVATPKDDKIQAAKEKFLAAVTQGLTSLSNINITLSYEDPLKSQDSGDSVLSSVQAIIASGGSLVLGSDWADNSFNAGTERDAIELEKASVQVQGKWAGLGWDSAPGMVAREIKDTYQKYLDNKAQQNQAIGSKQYDINSGFHRSMLMSAAQAAASSLSYANSVQNRIVEAKKAVVRAAIDVCSLLASRIQNTIEINKMDVDTAIKNFELAVSKSEIDATAKADQYHLNLLNFQRDSQKYKNDLTFFRETLQAYRYQLSLAEVNDRVQLSNDSLTLTEAITRARVTLTAAKIALESAARTIESKIHATASGGRLYSNALASAENSVATLVTLQNLGEMDTSSAT